MILCVYCFAYIYYHEYATAKDMFLGDKRLSEADFPAIQKEVEELPKSSDESLSLSLCLSLSPYIYIYIYTYYAYIYIYMYIYIYIHIILLIFICLYIYIYTYVTYAYIHVPHILRGGVQPEIMAHGNPA